MSSIGTTPSRRNGARSALIIFSLINLLNYVDRYVISSVKELIKKKSKRNKLKKMLKFALEHNKKIRMEKMNK